VLDSRVETRPLAWRAQRGGTMAGPGNKKRKVAGVGIDFKRAKHKVGKRLPPPRNVTDTTVRSRVIALPSQSVAQDKGSAAVSERNLTLKVRAHRVFKQHACYSVQCAHAVTVCS